MYSREQLIQERIEILQQMNAYICDEIGDEEVWEVWNALGVPDCATDEDYRYMAEHDDTWRDTCALFGKLLNQEERRED